MTLPLPSSPSHPALDWWLFLDDERDAFGAEMSLIYKQVLDYQKIEVARSTKEAIALIKAKGMPAFMALDHDLGGSDTTMRFLGWLSESFPFGEVAPPPYNVHSANPVGSMNIHAFINSWRTVYTSSSSSS